MNWKWVLVFVSVALSGCGSMNAALNGTTQVVEYYRVFDVQSDSPVSAMIAATRDGLARNTSNISDYRPIVSQASIPVAPGRLSTANPLQNSNLSALMGAQANILKRASCDGAVWMATVTRGGNTPVKDSFATISVCLWHYAKGDHIDLYANMSEQKGGFGVDAAGRSMAHGLVGTPEEWIETTFNAIPRHVQKQTGATIALIDAYPEPQGQPWLCMSGDQC